MECSFGKALFSDATRCSTSHNILFISHLVYIFYSLRNFQNITDTSTIKIRKLQNIKISHVLEYKVIRDNFQFLGEGGEGEDLCGTSIFRLSWILSANK